MIFPSNFHCRKVNPLIYIKFWRQARLPSLLNGTELFSLTPALPEKLEPCQQWFLKNVFYVLKFAPKQLLLKLSGLKSFEMGMALKRLLFLGRLLSGHKMAQVFRKCLKLRLIATLMPISSLWEFCPLYARYYTSMVFLIILNHGIISPVSRSMLH